MFKYDHGVINFSCFGVMKDDADLEDFEDSNEDEHDEQAEHAVQDDMDDIKAIQDAFVVCIRKHK